MNGIWITLFCFLPGNLPHSEVSENPKLEQISWLTGGWTGAALGGEVEEYWTPASAGTMLGVFRLVVNGELKVIEYLLITQEKKRVVLRFKHFRSDYSTWEEDRPLEFTLMKSSDRTALFHSEVPEQNAPRRITYQLDGDNNLIVTIEGSDENGKRTESFEVRLERI